MNLSTTATVYSKRKGAPKPPPDAIYVGRPSKWGNPYSIDTLHTREMVIRMFEFYALDRLEKEPEWLRPLIGHDLTCWCAPLPCHADVLVRLVQERYGEGT